MSLTKMLPSLIIVLIIQLYILFWSIRKVLFNKEMLKGRKAIWISILLFVPVLGVIFFLFSTRNKSHNKTVKDLGNGFDANIQYSIFLGLFYAFVLLMFVIIYINPDNIWITVLLSTATVLIVVLHLFKDKMIKLLRYILPFLLVLAVTVAQYISVTEEYGFIILIAVATIIIEYPLNYSKVFIAIPLVMFLMGSLIKLYSFQSTIPPNYLIEFVFTNSLTYMFVAGGFYFAKRQLVMNNYLQYLMRELKNKTQELEESSMLKERNRIAREIHDALGHTLTGAIIQLEVAKQLVDTSPEKAKASIQKTQDITRDGFNDVKRAIKALRPIMIEENTLADGLQLLFERMEKYYNYCVKDSIILPEVINEELKISVYRVIQELITNSIRHGEASEMKLSIEHQFNTLRINCRDNGKGCAIIKEGNGLKGIKGRVNKLGGNVKFSSKINEGFEIIIYIPL